MAAHPCVALNAVGSCMQPIAGCHQQCILPRKRGTSAAILSIGSSHNWSIQGATVMCSLLAVQVPAAMAHRAVAIDGSILEGGGQILRNASALSAITGCQLTVKDIRANRDKPGLRPQHCTGLQLIASISDGTVQGCHVGSTSMSLVPGRLAARSITGDTGTAGSCMLLCQSILPCCLYAEPGDDSCSGRGLNVEAIPTTHVALKGGTDASMAPVIGYLQHVLVPTLLRLFSLRVSLTLLKRGFFPRGQGRAELQVAALPVRPMLTVPCSLVAHVFCMMPPIGLAHGTCCVYFVCQLQNRSVQHAALSLRSCAQRFPAHAT